MEKEYIYLVQTPLDRYLCKMGKTNDLEKFLEEYNNECNNSITNKSKKTICKYLFTCQVANMTLIEYDFWKLFSKTRIDNSEDIYFCNDALFDYYVEYIRWHKMYIKQLFRKKTKKISDKERQLNRTKIDELLKRE